MSVFPTASTAELLAAMTVDDKVALLSGRDVWRTVDLADFGVPSVKVTDGPNGARGDSTTGASAVCLPAAIAMAASFDTGLVTELGRLLGREAARKASHVLLAPTINLARHPLGGRNFESFGEDPALTSILAAAYVRGVQDEGIGACAKHFVANDTEDGRLTVSSEVDEATLREIYLAPFEAAVAAGVWTVMAAYPKLNGTHCTENRWLLTDVLRGEWRFDGLVMSDWSATDRAGPSVAAGLDLEMPGPARALGPHLVAAVEAGEVSGDELDRAAGAVIDLVRRAAGPPPRSSGAADDDVERSVDAPEERALVRRAAADGMVLLANRPIGDGGALLPVDPVPPSVAVIGPNADPGVIQGGGSAQLKAHYRMSPLDGLRQAMPEARIEHRVGCVADRYAPAADPAAWVVGEGDEGGGPLRLEVFAHPEFGGEPIQDRRTGSIEAFYHGKRRNMPDIDRWSQRWSGRMRIDVAGRHRFGVLAIGRSRVLVDGEMVADNWTDPRPGQAFFERASEEVVGEVDLAAGAEIDVVVEWSSGDDHELAGLRFGHRPPIDEDGLMADAAAAAADADMAVVVVGLTAEWETESHDRPLYGLPGRQDELVRRVVAANPRTVVVVNAGGPVDLPWLDAVPATVMAWYPGQEFGNALSDVLLGRRDPGGRLPVTFPAALGDAPTAETVPGDGRSLHYAEGLFVGNRWYDRHGIRPRLAFGHGLSYAEFRLGRPELVADAGPGDDVIVALSVVNTAARSGKCVVQVYLRPGQVDRPRTLVGFAAVELAAGEERSVSIACPPRALQRWDGGWVPMEGRHELEIGRASDAIDHRLELVVP